MRRAGDILADLGFKENASEGAQRAFLKNLVRAAYGAEVTALPVRQPEPSSVPQKEKKLVNGEAVQLSFVFESNE